MIEQDLHMTQEFLSNVFSDAESISFAYPGADPVCSQGSYESVVNEAFTYARSGLKGVNELECDTRNLRYEDLSGMSAEQFESWRSEFVRSIEKDETVPSWHVLRFGRMFDGESHSALLMHELVISMIADYQHRLWVAPLCDVANQLLTARVLPSRL